MKQFICTVCPRGCRLSVDEENGYKVTGNTCQRGELYGKTEATDPRRTLTSTVKIKGAALSRCPVRTSAAIPKKLMFEAMGEINKLIATSPIKRGDVLIKNLLGTGADLIATRDM